MRYSSRFFLYAPFLVLVAILGVAMLRWWSLAAPLESRLTHDNGREIAPGVTLRFAQEETGGFPFEIDVVMSNVEIAVATPRGPFVWHTERFARHSLTYGPDVIVFEAAGRQGLAWTDSGGARHDLQFVPGSLRASAILKQGRVERFDLDLVDPESPDISGARVQLHARQDATGNGIEFFASADAMHFSLAHAGMGRALHQLRLQGVIAPAASFTTLLSGLSDWRSSAENWRARAGTLSLSELAFQFDNVTATARGRLSLDGAHRPSGALDLVLSGAMVPPAAYESYGPLARALAVTAGTTGRPRGARLLLHDGFADLVPADDGRSLPAESDEHLGRLDPLY